MPFDSQNLRDGVITEADIQDSEQEMLLEQAVALIAGKMRFIDFSGPHSRQMVQSRVEGMLEMAALFTTIDVEALREMSEEVSNR